jgi:hypothetical protein
MKLTSHLHLVRNLMMSRSVTLRPPYALMVKEGQFYLCLRTTSRNQYDRKAGYLSPDLKCWLFVSLLDQNIKQDI